VNCNVLVYFIQICLLWKCSMPFRLKPVSSATRPRLLKNRDFHCIVERTTGNTLGVGENQADLSLNPLQMVRLQQLFMENMPHRCQRHTFSSLRSTNTRTGILPCASQYAPFHSICSYISPSPAFTADRRTVPRSLMLRPRT
jgi:hypothetical protein